MLLLFVSILFVFMIVLSMMTQRGHGLYFGHDFERY